MPSFDLMDKVELFLRTGTFPVDASKSSKKVTRAASKHFIYKDDLLWRSYRGRLLRVVRSDEEVREILTRYHDNNNHAGRTRAVREIMLMFYWVGVTEAVKNWIKTCAYCQSRVPADPPEPPVRFCLAYGCDASSYVYPELSFHRFPKEAARRQRWLEVAQRDEGSLRMTSCLCSRHFEPSCFMLSEEGQLTLSPDAVPTIIPVTVEDEVGVASDETFLQSDALGEHVSTAAAVGTPESPEVALDISETPVELLEHQYSLPLPDHNVTAVQTEHERRKTVIEPNFAIYNQIARYLSHRILPMESKKSRFALKRMSKRFGLIDGALMYTRVSPPLRVPRSREEVNSILKQFHDNQGHYGQGICQREITKHFYWTSMTRDLGHWINNCSTCLNRTKRKWLRCSVSSCTNCCGPVERGLGLTFHKFPLHNEALLAQWMKAVGRPHWHPRLWSSVCSAHFAEDCFDRSGEKVTLHPEATPTLQIRSDSATAAQDVDQPAVGEEVCSLQGRQNDNLLNCVYAKCLFLCEQAYFAKYDAVALYLSRRKYPAGLTYVEKNTFRRFCKKFAIKDDELHVVSGDRVLLVLRSRQQVEAALVDYHNELNHLDANKCLRLLNERYFWKTMRPDVVQWVNSCPQCSSRKRKAAQTGSGSQLEAQACADMDSGKEDDDCSDDDDGEGCGSDEEWQPNLQAKIPIRLQPRPPVDLQSKAPVIFKPRTPNCPCVASIRSAGRSSPPQCGVQQETSGSQGSAATPHATAKPLTGSHAPSAGRTRLLQGTSKKVQPSSQSRGQKTQLHMSTGQGQHPQKRKRDLEVDSPAERTRCGRDPVEAPSTKPWPVFTIAKPPPEGDSPAPYQRPSILQARTVIQQCSEAKVKTRPALDGADAQWAEIHEGMVVYVCFFHGATEDIVYEMAGRLMTTKLFRRDTGRSVSILDLPGSVLLIPQESLVGQPLTKRKIEYRGGCEQWWGGQLFSNLVSACRGLMSASVKCTTAGGKVEHGVYGPKQEIVLNSLEPLTLLLEF